MKPTKEQIAEAKKRGIVEGVSISCAAVSCDSAVVPPPSKWVCWDDLGMGFRMEGVALDRVYISIGSGARWATVIKPAPAKRKTASQPRIKGRFAAKSAPRNEEILQGILDRLHGIESTISKVESSVAVIRSGSTFMQQLEQDAPNWTPKFRDLVMTPDGEGVYWRTGNAKVLHAVVFAGGTSWYTLDQLTPIEP